jgi:acetyl esterase/lipase
VPGAWFAPPDADPAGGAIFYLHGGAYYTGSVDAYAAYLAHIADVTAMPVLAIDYRLAPANPFPAALEDALAAFKWMLANGVDPSRLVIMGDSAGGGLTMATMIALRDDEDFSNDQLPAAAVVISPWADLAGIGETIVTLAEVEAYLKWPGSLEQNAADYAGDKDPHNPLISPVYADLNGLPPLLIMVGGREILLSDSTRLARRARLAGVDVTLDVWEGMIHVWPMFGEFLPESGWALEEISDFVHAHID